MGLKRKILYIVTNSNLGGISKYLIEVAKDVPQDFHKLFSVWPRRVLPRYAACQQQPQRLLRLNILQGNITRNDFAEDPLGTQLPRYDPAGVVVKIQHQQHIAHGCSLLH